MAAEEQLEPVPPRHRARRVLVGVGLVVAVVLVGVVVLLASRRQPVDLSADDVLEGLRESGGVTQGPDETRGPDAGVYPGTGEGNEFVGLAPLDEPFGPSIPVTVSYVDDTCWNFDIRLNSHHSRDWTLCADDDGLVQRAGASATERNFPGFVFSNRTTFTCEPTVVVLRWDDEPGTTRTGRCLGSSTDLEGETTLEISSTVVGTDVVPIEGNAVGVIHVRRDSELIGAQSGPEILEMWIDPDTGLPLRVSFDTQVATDTPFGPIDYRDVGSVTLDSLEAQR